MDGSRLRFSEADVQATADAYARATEKAPIVIGHPPDNAPAFGLVESLHVAGGALIATPGSVDAGFAELVRDGRYKKVSASFYRPDAPSNPHPGVWSLLHVGFLGAAAPAVKGLAPVAFAAGGESIVITAPEGAFTSFGDPPLSNPFPFPVNPASTALSILYRNTRFIGDQVSPRILVSGVSFRYFRHNLGDGFTVPNTMTGRRGRPTEVTFDATEERGLTVDYALDDPVPAVDVDNAPKEYNPLDYATMMLTDLILLDREKRVAAQTFNPATYQAANKRQLSGTSQWSDYANSDPIGDLDTAIGKLIIRPNTLVIGRQAWDKLKRHPKLIKALHGPLNDDGFATAAQLAKLFELDQVLVGETWINSAKMGQTATLSRIWGPHAALLWLAPNLKSPQGAPTFGFTAQYGTRLSGNERDSSIGMRGGYRVRVGESVAEVIACPDLGFLIQDAVA